MQVFKMIEGERPILTPEADSELRRLETSRRPSARCHAAHSENGCDVTCGIEGVRIEGRQNPSTVLKLCFADYTQCPSWRRHVDERKTQEENAKQLLREKAKTDEIDAARAAGEPID